jgi:hypothetical protein
LPSPVRRDFGMIIFFHIPNAREKSHGDARRTGDMR